MGMNINDFETMENKIIPRMKRSVRETVSETVRGRIDG